MRLIRRAPLWVRLALILVLSQAAIVACIFLYGAFRVREIAQEEARGVQTSAELLQNTIYELLIVSSIGGLAITFAAVVFVFRLGGAITQIRRLAVSFAQGDLRHRIEPLGTAEFHDVARSLNRMAEQLSGQINLLQQQRNEQETILQSMQVGVIAIDRDQTVLSVNRVAQLMLGLTGAAARGRRLDAVTDEASLLRFAADALAEPTDLAREFDLRAEPPLNVRAIAGNLRNADGDPVGTVIILSDITHVRRLERLRTDFAANASHELRTPITNIKGYVETLLEDGALDSEHSPRFLGIIARNAERLGAIIDDMLALTSLERVHGPEEIVTAPTPVGPMLHTVRAHLEPDARAKQTRVLVKIGTPLFIEVNSRLAEQAVANLVSNSIKYGNIGGTITVTAEPDELPGDREAVRITISDDGPGIPQQDLPRIFERFYRVDKARSREQGGTGLGLAIVKHIALVHRGTVTAQSAPGRGATFILTLPRADDPAERSDAEIGLTASAPHPQAVDRSTPSDLHKN